MPWQTKYHFPACPSAADILAQLGDNCLILLQAGGNWGSLYRDEQVNRLDMLVNISAEIARKRQSAHVVQLPQSIWYNESLPDVLRHDNLTLHTLGAGLLHLYVRQADSFKFAQHTSPGPGPVEVGLSPDVAFMVEPSLPSKTPDVDVLLLLRNDREGVSKPPGESPEDMAARLLGPHVTFKVTDWPVSKEFYSFPDDASSLSQFAELRWRFLNNVLSQGLIVVTDRLHASIASVLLGKPHIILDNVYQKVTRTRSVAFAVSEHCNAFNLQATTAASLDDALQQASRMLAEPFYFN